MPYNKFNIFFLVLSFFTIALASQEREVESVDTLKKLIDTKEEQLRVNRKKLDFIGGALLLFSDVKDITLKYLLAYEAKVLRDIEMAVALSRGLIRKTDDSIELLGNPMSVKIQYPLLFNTTLSEIFNQQEEIEYRAIQEKLSKLLNQDRNKIGQALLAKQESYQDLLQEKTDLVYKVKNAEQELKKLKEQYAQLSIQEISRNLMSIARNIETIQKYISQKNFLLTAINNLKNNLYNIKNSLFVLDRPWENLLFILKAKESEFTPVEVVEAIQFKNTLFQLLGSAENIKQFTDFINTTLASDKPEQIVNARIKSLKKEQELLAKQLEKYQEDYKQISELPWEEKLKNETAKIEQLLAKQQIIKGIL